MITGSQQLANQIVSSDFPNDTGTFPVSYVKTWLECNLGELNARIDGIYEMSTGDLFICSGDSSVSTGMNNQEASIYGKMYEIQYYDRVIRDLSMGLSAGGTAEWIMLKEGDSVIQREGKNQMIRSITALRKDASNELKDLIFSYKHNKSWSRQVAGEDGV